MEVEQPQALRSGELESELVKSEPQGEERSAERRHSSKADEKRSTAPTRKSTRGVHKRSIKKPGMRFGRWDAVEHKRFLEAMEKFGNSWKQVCEYIQTRTPDQIRSHAQKHYEGIKTRLIKEIKEDPGKQKAIFVVTREYWNTNGMARASTERLNSPGKDPDPSPAPERNNVGTKSPSVIEMAAGGGLPALRPQTEGCRPAVRPFTLPFPTNPAWMMLAQSYAYANSVLLSQWAQFSDGQHY